MFDMVAECPAADAVFDAAGTVLGKDPRVFVKQNDLENIYTNRSGQILCCTQALAVAAVLEKTLSSRSILCAGYSVGELGAWGVAGCLTPRQVLELAARRADLMDAVSPRGAGLAGLAGIPRRTIEEIIEKCQVWIAISNTPESVVIGGTDENLDRAIHLALRAGAGTARRLKVAVPSHTPLLKKAVSPLLDAVLMQHPLPPRRGARLISGYDGEPVFQIEDGVRRLAKQVASTVHWDACMEACVEAGSMSVLELGPGTALARMAHGGVLKDGSVRAVEDFHSLAGLQAWLEQRT
ncbi:acyltransferase domain-containing protein [Acetobacter sp. TBRC 12305]|uniref:Acyltransferase domain-containing protein n=2 Tax=Acetobacter garciniae TaxID=2817435 RepID=A0A939KMK1_9PROT|nr:acyltransferase domain-containing protein [Acetobacter garciniae]MBX0345410.1 acyltransferase domain-containing protein [Acetobacter garciniae]